MPILGAHMSIAGGYHKAPQKAAELRMQCCQIFTKNNNQWRAKPITAAEAEQFKQAIADAGLVHPIAHDSYLINLAAPDDELWNKSIDAFAHELERAALLGIPWVVAHPGAFTTGTEESGLQRIIAALDEVRQRTGHLPSGCLLENTAGQGSSLGNRFEHLATIIEGVKDASWLGVCIDTCHVFAAGYPLATTDDYRSTFKAMDATFGLGLIKAFHLNDSVKPLGSRVDRHAHIGEGLIGIDAFRQLLNDQQFAQIPMYLETPKGMRDDTDLDEVNLATLRSLVDEVGRNLADEAGRSLVGEAGKGGTRSRARRQT
jgi:deoxyribonuclease-4